MNDKSRVDRVDKAVRVPGLVLMRWVFFIMYVVQKVTNNAEGLTKFPLVKQLSNPTSEGGFALSSGRVGSFRADSALAWYVKALFGPIVDNLPLFGYPKKGWVILSSLLCSLAWGWVALFGQSSVTLLFIGVLFVNLMVALGDVICDGMMVEMSQNLEAKYTVPTGSVNRSLQGSQWLGAMVAMTASALAGGFIAQYFGLRWAAMISGVVPILLVLFIALAVKEEKVAWDPIKARKGYATIGLVLLVSGIFTLLGKWDPPTVVALLLPLAKAAILIGAMLLVVKVPRQLIVPAVFMLLWFGLPLNTDAGYCVGFFTTHYAPFIEQVRSNEGAVGSLWRVVVVFKGISPEDLEKWLAGGNELADLYYGSVVSTVGAVGGAIAALLFMSTNWLQRLRLAKLLQVCVVMQMVLVGWLWFSIEAMSPVHLLMFAFVGTFGGICVLLGALSYGAGVIPRRDQAALYAFLMSMSNIGTQYGSDVIGGALYDHFGDKQEVKDAAGEVTDVIMNNPLGGMAAVLTASFALLVGLWFFVGWLDRKGKLNTKPAEE